MDAEEYHKIYDEAFFHIFGEKMPHGKHECLPTEPGCEPYGKPIHSNKRFLLR